MVFLDLNYSCVTSVGKYTFATQSQVSWTATGFLLGFALHLALAIFPTSLICYLLIKSTPNDATTTMLLCRDDVLRLKSSVGFSPNMALCTRAKTSSFGLMRPQNLFPQDC